MLEILRDLVETDQKGIPDSEPRVEEVWVTAVFAEVPCALVHEAAKSYLSIIN